MFNDELRLTIFFAVLALCLVLEYFFSWRQARFSVARLSKHLGIIFVGSFINKLLLPAGLVSCAMYAQVNGWGLLNLFDDISASIVFFVSLFVLDFLIYWQHVFSHRWPLLWRLHRVHHSDLHVDASTALRFHPLEIALSTGYKLFFILLLGLPASAVFVFEILLNGLAMFNHSNIKLSLGVDKWLNKAIVTPSMHRVHHSQIASQTNSNYGFCLSWWDSLFATRIHMTDEYINLGLKEYSHHLGFVALLLMPFRR